MIPSVIPRDILLADNQKACDALLQQQIDLEKQEKEAINQRNKVQGELLACKSKLEELRRERIELLREPT